MTKTRMLMVLFIALTSPMVSGCAWQYFGDPGCHVECRYCAAPPLPYGYYPDCTCHSCAASPYLSVSRPPASEPDSETHQDP